MLNSLIPTFSKTLFASAILLCISFGGTPALAQIYNDYQESDRSVNNAVIIYEDCGYRGESRILSADDYPTMRELDFGNDSISSIRVPQGYEAIIYEDRSFNGPYARIDRDISCFDKHWNDQVSSIKVSDKRGLRNRENNARNEPYRDNNSDRDGNAQRGDKGKPKVTAKNVTRVVFEDRVLQQINKRQWQMADARYGVSQYRETSRDSSAVYLQNDYTDEKIRIDLFANDITFVDGKGRTQRYAIQGKQSTLSAAPSSPNRTSSAKKEAYRVGANGCFRYKAYTRGGQGGIRFHGKEGFHRFYKKGYTDRICGNGALTMELNKTDLTTDVIVEIDGRKIKFAANERPAAYKNSWYRKLITLNVR